MEYPGPERDAKFNLRHNLKKSFSLLSHSFASLAQGLKNVSM
jgi:hypothetical protein